MLDNIQGMVILSNNGFLRKLLLLRLRLRTGGRAPFFSAEMSVKGSLILHLPSSFYKQTNGNNIKNVTFMPFERLNHC